MSQKTYKVHSQRQLVDLNGDSKNFDLTFTCTSKDGAPFDVLVVDQTTLDSTPTLQYKRANGTISGNIVADKDVYQNYFLVLKSDKPCEVTVKTVKKEIQPNLPTQRPVLPSAAVQKQRPPIKPPTKPGRSNWKIIAITVLVLGGGALLYYFYTQNKNKKQSSLDTLSTSVVPSVVPSVVLPVVPPVSSVVPSSPASSISPSPGGLLDRLKSLNMSN